MASGSISIRLLRKVTARHLQICCLVLVVPPVFQQACAEEVYRDKYVTAYVERRSPLLGNVHGDETTDLKVLGKMYKRVRGLKPYYIEIPELKSILFVTEDGEEIATLHLVNVETGKDKTFKLGPGAFGSSIGYEQFGRKKGAPFTDYLEKASPATIVLCSVFPDGKEIHTIDLKSGSVSRETIYYDKEGRVKKRYVDGKLVQ